MKAGWEVKPLGKVAKVSSGNSAPQDEESFSEGSIPFIRTSDVGQIRFGKTTTARDLINEVTAEKLRMFPPSTIFFPKSGASTFLNHRVMTGVDCCAASHLATIQANEDQVSPDFLLYYLSTVDARDLVQDSKYPSLNLPIIKGIPIPLPPLEEQRRIAAVLDEAFEGLNRARANTETNLTNARELFESVLFDLYEVQMKGLKRKRLSDVCDLISGQHIEAKDYNAEGIGIGYLTGPSDFGDINPVVTKWTEYPKRTALAGDILITVKGSGVGSVNIMNHDELAISRQLMAIRSKGIPIRYLFGFIRMQQGHFKSLSNGAAIPGISRGDVLELEIPIPLNANQDKYVEYLVEAESHVNIAEQAYTAKLSDLADLRQSLLQKAFAGELT